MSTLCFFLLLSGGAAYASTQLGKNSVGAKQLKKNSVTTAKVKNGSLKAADIGGPVNDSANLAGSPASAYKDQCPAGTKLVGGSLCAIRPAELKGTWLEGVLVCAELHLRLPSSGEALMVGSSAGAGDFWTDDYFVGPEGDQAVIYLPEKREITDTSINSPAGVVCVTTPTDS